MHAQLEVAESVLVVDVAGLDELVAADIVVVAAVGSGDGEKVVLQETEMTETQDDMSDVRVLSQLVMALAETFPFSFESQVFLHRFDRTYLLVN